MCQLLGLSSQLGLFLEVNFLLVVFLGLRLSVKQAVGFGLGFLDVGCPPISGLFQGSKAIGVLQGVKLQMADDFRSCFRNACGTGSALKVGCSAFRGKRLDRTSISVGLVCAVRPCVSDTTATETFNRLAISTSRDILRWASLLFDGVSFAVSFLKLEYIPVFRQYVLRGRVLSIIQIIEAMRTGGC